MELDVNPKTASAPASVEMPAPTAWPVVLAFGLTLLFAGLLTSVTVSVLGAILTVAGCVGWFGQVLPHERHETVPVVTEAVPIVTERREVVRIEIVPEMHRARLPIEIYPISAGIKGGLAGSVAMAALASLYGVLAHGSIWYPINLLAAVVYAQPLQLSMRAAYFVSAPRCCWWPQPCTWSPQCWLAFFTVSCCRCSRAGRFCWAASSLPSCGRGCCIRVSGSSTLC